MYHTTYPTIDGSEDFSAHSQVLFLDDPWSAGDFSHDITLASDGLEDFENNFYDSYDSFSSDVASSDPTTEEEITSTPPPSSPLPDVESSMMIEVKPEPLFYSNTAPTFYQAPVVPQQQPVHQFQQQAMMQYQQYQQYQYQLYLQQKMLIFQPCATSPSFVESSSPLVKSPLDSYNYAFAGIKTEPPSSVALTSLDTSEFGSNGGAQKLHRIPVDISGNLTDSQYNKIFKKYHLQLHLDSHPTMTEQDLEDVKVNGRMYFLKNVKTIVPKIGPWKFNAHISHRRADERQYNIPGMAVTCKVKEWLTDDGLWRLYHYKKGKVIKSKKTTEY